MTALAASGLFKDGAHHYPVRVFYEDTDAAGIVYYANYLKFAERARTEMIRLFGLEQRELMEQAGLAFAVRKCTADYLRPARLDDHLVVVSRLTAIGGASMAVEQSVTRDGVPLVELSLKLACMTTEGRPARIPPDLRDKLTFHLSETM